MISVNSYLSDDIDNGETLYPIVICVSETPENDGTYSYKAFYKSTVVQQQFEVNKYSSNNTTFPEFGTAISAECNFSLIYDQNYLQWLKAGNAYHLFVYSRNSMGYINDLIDGDLTIVDRPPGTTWQVDEQKTYLYLGKSIIASGVQFKYGSVMIWGNGSIVYNSADWCPMGMFFPDKLSVDKHSIKVTGLDTLTKLDLPLSNYTLLSQAAWGTTITLEYLANWVRTVSGYTVDYDDTAIAGSTEVIYRNEDLYNAMQPSKTVRNLLQYVAQLHNCNLVVPADNPFVIKFVYATSPNISTAQYYCADSTNFSYGINAFEYQVMTGVCATVDNTEYAPFRDQEYGSESKDIYIQDISSNDVFAAADDTVRSRWIYLVQYNMRGHSTPTTYFRWYPYEAKIVQEPRLETLDVVSFEDLDGTRKTTPIHRISYRINAPTSIACVGGNYK